MDKRKEFIKDLQLLLKKYNAEITLEDDYDTYYSAQHMCVDFEDYSIPEINLGGWIDSKKEIE